MLIRIIVGLIMIISTLSAFQTYSVDNNFEVSRLVNVDELAHARYQNSMNLTGWDSLYIYANKNADALLQHRAAGFLQGYITYRQIHAAFVNFARLDFKNSQFAPPNVQQFLDDQLQYMRDMISKNGQSIFWQYANNYLQQVQFMYKGYERRIKLQKLTQYQLTFQQFYYLTSVGDLEDLLPMNKSSQGQGKNCNAYIKLNKGQLFVTHATHNRYSMLLRIYKHWNFPRQGIALQSTSFTSRPGDLISKDDFYILSSGLRVLETSLQNFDPENIQKLKSSTVPSWLRTLIANHLSKNAQMWIDYFNMFRSGTHNNQWIIIDTKNLPKRQKIVTFFQEAFTLYKTFDMTYELLQNGYVAGYNTPISQQISYKLKNNFPINYYRTQRRAIILSEYHPKMNNQDDMKYWLINNQENELDSGLAPRYDLLQNNSRAFGLTDCKILSPKTEIQNYFWAIGGPSTSNGKFPPFDWKKWKNPNTPHQGLPQTYDFGWQKIIIDIQKPHILQLQIKQK